jgi:hypothetical protein
MRNNKQTCDIQYPSDKYTVNMWIFFGSAALFPDLYVGLHFISINEDPCTAVYSQPKLKLQYDIAEAS